MTRTLKGQGKATLALPESQEQAEISVEFLLLFAVKMIREVGSDVVTLAAWSAAKDLGLSREQADRFILKALEEQKVRGHWPPGFMP